MPTEQEYINYKDFVESLDEATPSANDKAVFNDANGPKGSVFSAIAAFVHNTFAAFVNALTVKTSFASGDKITVVNGNTATAMPKDTLLLLTAENSLLHKGSVDASSAPYNDLDTYPNNEAVLVTTGYADVAHIPVSESFSVVTLSSSNSSTAKVQILTTSTKKTYIRSAFGGTFGEWRNLENEITPKGSVSVSAPYNDLNTFPNNEVVLITSDYTSVAHRPADEAFNAVTISNAATSTAKMQIVTTQTNKVYIRSAFGGYWGDWVPLENKDDVIGVGSVDASSAPYNDLDTYPNNKVALVSSGYGSVSHNPSNKPFNVATFSNSKDSSAKFQILSTSSGELFLRAAFGGVFYGWKDLDNVILPKGSVSVSSPYNDLDTYPNNEVVLVTTDYNSVAHRPANESFTVTTLSNSKTSSVKIQILTTASRKMFMRCSYGSTWRDWKDFDNEILPKGGQDTNAPYNDLNTFPSNEVVLITTGYESVAHTPVSESFSVATISNSKSSSAKFQILTTQNNKIYMRSAYGSLGWGEWARVDRHNDGFPGNPLLGSFENMLFIGDSLTYSAVFYGSVISQNRQAHTPYPESFAYLCKSTATIKAVSGYTAKQWWDEFNDDIPTLTNALAVVYLGTNSGFTDTLAEDAPVNTDPSTWDDTTNTGCYALIINKLITLGYKVLCVKPWVTGGDIDITKKVVGEAAARFGCCAVDAPVNRLFKYHAYPDGSGQNTVHYNDLGYAWFASALVDAVANAPDEQVRYIVPE